MTHPLILQVAQQIERMLAQLDIASLRSAPTAPVRAWVGLSGGVDSVVLLHVLLQVKARLSVPVEIRAVYINHQLSPHATEWGEFCADYCRRLGVEFTVEAVRVDVAGAGLEDAARRARYAVFRRLLAEPALLLLGQHADDQAETLLLRLARGTGVHGMRGMPELRPLAAGFLARPLLRVTREDIEAYAQSQNLSHITDESNLSLVFDRNFIRHNILAPLRSRWPRMAQTTGESMRAVGEADALLDELACDDIAACDPRHDMAGVSVDLAKLQTFSRLRQRNALRVWLREAFDITFTRQHFDEVMVQLTQYQSSAQTQFVSGAWTLRVYANRLYVVATSAEWHVQLSPAQPGISGLRLRGRPTDYRVEPRAGGERCQPIGRAHSQTLKKLLQEADVPTWLRETISVVWCGDVVAAVGNLWVCEGFACTEASGGVELLALYK